MIRINDGSSRAPRLELQQSWWAMTGLGDNGKEWSTEEKVEKIAEAGFQGIVGRIPGENEADAWHKLLDRYQLSFAGLSFPGTPEAVADTLESARRFGRVQYINSQVMDAFVVDGQAVELIRSLLRQSEEVGIPNYIETHRGTVTQDLLRTVGYMEILPELPLMIDLSHYVVAGEMNGTSAAAEACFDALLARTAGIHARVSNGEQVQIDVGAEGEHPMVPHFCRWWKKGMREWLKGASPGDILPFVTELGPPYYYAITRRDSKGHEIEISDRWQQALLFKRIAEELWIEAVREG